MKLFGKKADKGNQNNNQDNNQNNNQNNNQDNLNPFAVKSDNKDNNGNSNANNNGQNNNNDNNNDNTQSNKNFSMTEFYKKSGLYDGINMKEFTAAIRDGGDEAETKVAAIMAKVMENAVSVSLTQANKLADAKVATIKDTVVQETRSSAEMNMAVRQMNGALPFTSHEAVAPVAKQILTGFLKQGLSIDDAVKNTSEYYKEVAQESGQHFGLDIREKGDNTGFGNSRMQHEHHNKNNNDSESDKEEEDWISTLTSGNQTEDTMQAASDSNSSGSGNES